MSLIKQLWIATLCLTLLALGGSLVVGTLSARDYLVQALTVKNIDNAGGLALALSHLPKDPVSIELQLSARMDTGHYRLIRLVDPKGEVVAEQVAEGGDGDVPIWFRALIPMQAAAGVAQVQDGWHQFGTLSVVSHDRYAYESLWRSTLDLLLWFAVGGVACGALVTLLLKRILRPLDDVVEQATAIGERRFVSTREPGTLEFRRVVGAMNALSARVRLMLGEEAERLETLRFQSQHDDLTRLMTRTQFLRRVESALAREDEQAGGTLVIARVGDIASLNRQHGRPVVDDLLRALGHHLLHLASSRPDWEAGRLNGTDFALLATGEDDATGLAKRVQAVIEEALALAGDGTRLEVAFPLGACAFSPGTALKSLLARTDGALAIAEQAGARAISVADPDRPSLAHTELAGWRQAIEGALQVGGMQLGRFPVVDTTGELLHFEAPVRLAMDGGCQSAGYFMPWAARLGVINRIDAEVVRLALRSIASSGEPLGINISAESLRDAGFRSLLLASFAEQPASARQLWVEVPEYGVVQHPNEFRELCHALKPLGCRIGIEHCGRQLKQLGDLHDLGLDYLKVDAALIRGIDTDAGNQSVLRSLCVLAHSIGVRVIAEGVSSDAERLVLPALGIDGMTGPGVRYVGPDKA